MEVVRGGRTGRDRLNSSVRNWCLSSLDDGSRVGRGERVASFSSVIPGINGWYNRNEKRHGEEIKEGKILMNWALHYLEKSYAAVDEPQPTSTQEAVVASWTPPPVTNFKVNVDGAIFSEQRAVGIGVVVRDDQGRVAATISKRINEHLWAVEAEAKAFEEGLQLAKDIGIQDFILE